MSVRTKERTPGRLRAVTAVALVSSLIAGGAPALAQSNDGLLKISVVQGEGSLNNIKKKLAQAPIVEVKDEAGRPVEGAAVVFTLPFSGPSGKFTSGERTFETKTDAQGRATAAEFTPNDVEGRLNINVTASLGDKKATAVIPQSNTLAGGLGNEGGRSFPRWLLGLGITGGATTALILARGGGGSSTPAAAPVPPTTITIGSVSVGGPR
jgi:hypothetical protein